MTGKAIILLSHGSKKIEAKKDLLEITKILGQKTNIRTELACMQLTKPSFIETIELLADQDYKEIMVIPFFLTNGQHMQEDIPELLQEARSKFGHLSITVTEYLWPDPNLIKTLKNRVAEVNPVKTKQPLTDPHAIEEKSFEHIDKLIACNFEPEEQKVVKRLIHTSGDLSLVHLIKFSNYAIEKTVEAIGKRHPVITDVSMVAAGISENLTEITGINLITRISDDDVRREAQSFNKTRASIAIEKSLLENPEAIVAIGNAPTALFKVAELIKSRAIEPAVVIAMPVGFVGTAESKETIKKTGVEHIIVEGTRGGSALAAASINAMLKIAIEQNMLVTQ